MCRINLESLRTRSDDALSLVVIMSEMNNSTSKANVNKDKDRNKTKDTNKVVPLILIKSNRIISTSSIYNDPNKVFSNDSTDNSYHLPRKSRKRTRIKYPNSPTLLQNKKPPIFTSTNRFLFLADTKASQTTNTVNDNKTRLMI